MLQFGTIVFRLDSLSCYLYFGSWVTLLAAFSGRDEHEGTSRVHTVSHPDGGWLRGERLRIWMEAANLISGGAKGELLDGPQVSKRASRSSHNVQVPKVRLLGIVRDP